MTTYEVEVQIAPDLLDFVAARVEGGSFKDAGGYIAFLIQRSQQEEQTTAELAYQS